MHRRHRRRDRLGRPGGRRRRHGEGSAPPSPTASSSRAAAPRSPSRPRSPRRSAPASAASTSTSARRSTSTPASAPASSTQGVRTFFSDTKVDLVIVRENTEDLYLGCEFEQGKPETAELIADIKRLNGKTIRPDSGISIKPISITGSRRIVKYAFEYARKHGRKKVTAVHKANILKYSDGLFLEVSREVAKEYPDIEFEDRIVDNMCMQLVQKPELYDVLVLPNLYGDILSDLGAGLVGGLGVAPGANIGEAGAVFEATHGSAPKYKGQ